MGRKNWWQPLFAVMIVGLAGVFFMGIRTYQDAPPIPTFIDERGQVIVSQSDVLKGQVLFQKYALMDYGSMFGDGASRGPDFTADALHQVAVAMNNFYLEGSQSERLPPDAAAAEVKREIRRNSYDAMTDRVTLTDAQAYAYRRLAEHYGRFFCGAGSESFQPAGYIKSDDDIAWLSSFFFWGAWVCGAERPGEGYSFTHNWPYDPTAGNLPTAPTLLWSVFGCLGLIAGVGGVLYARGRLERLASLKPAGARAPIATDQAVDAYEPSTLQTGAYKFFVAAVLLFLLQVLAGALTIHDFVGLTKLFGVDISQYLPVTVTRGWHLQLSLLWISACWIGASIFVLPLICAEQPRGQTALANSLFLLLLVIVFGTLGGVWLGPTGALGRWWHLVGNQGWEFVELGKLWQGLLFMAFALWAWIIYRGARPVIHGPEPLAIPNWIFYSVVSILVLFCSGFVATPTTNFVISDFWRWCVIHMWVESFFEVFTTALIAYFMCLMGLVDRQSAGRVVYLSTLLFLGSGILGISHNFYWNAKPVVTLALGSVFSTLQVVPLILLTLEAWRFRNLPGDVSRADGNRARFGQSEAFLFLVGVNFWNFVGAGVFGFIINLPIINYYEHGTYLTVNHGHAALMGVYGNLAIAAAVFCARYLIAGDCWKGRLLSCSFWSLNIGLMLMVVMDLFPLGVLQLASTLENGLWYSRSLHFVASVPFQTLTWMRAVGGYLFLVGGVMPLIWFFCSGASRLKAVAGKCELVKPVLPVGAEPDSA